MITFKQLEALYWISKLGSLESAALELNMSQSAISKRVLELEDGFAIEIFDRSRRSARLTEKGAELLECTKELLKYRDKLVEQVNQRGASVQNYRIGVTELTAMTWLPSLIRNIRVHYPAMKIEPSVEVGSELIRRLERGELDFIIVPDAYRDNRFVSMDLQAVEFSWMCAPDFINHDKPLALHDLSDYTILAQGAASGTGVICERWFARHDVKTPRVMYAKNLVAQVGLALSGLGVVYLPRLCMDYLLKRGELGVVDIEPSLPLIKYISLYRGDRLN